MRALSVLSLQDTRLLTAEAGKILSDMVATNTVLKELDLSSNNWKDVYGRLEGDGRGFAQELAVGIRDNGAISSVNLLKNGIGTHQARTLANILKEHSTLKSLCGNKGDEKELDMSGKMCGAEAVIMLAAEIVGNGASNNRALTSLNLASNELGVEGAKIIAAFLPKCT
jgi:hypothetical protein